jgi:hypothetical protein
VLIAWNHRPRARRSSGWAALALLIFAAGCGASVIQQPTGDAGQAGGDGGQPAVDGGRPTSDGGHCGSVPQKHRAAGVSCDHVRPATDPTDGGNGTCHSDNECTDGEDGRCLNQGFAAPRACSYDACFVDLDCSAKSSCECRDALNNGANTCLPGDCHVDADCAECGFCSPSPGGCTPFIGTEGYYCHKPADECTDDADCAAKPGTACNHSLTLGHWVCSPLRCGG